MKLDREHLGKLIRMDSLAVVQIPDGVFKEGDILMLFNNTDEYTTLESQVPNSYRSSYKGKVTMFEFAPHGLLTILFVADDTLVVTVGL